MDGNGRWAESRNLPRLKGHQEGVSSAREIIRACGEKGVKELTLYAFSTENWRRPKHEVDFLMDLLRRYLVSEREEARQNNVQVRAIGRLQDMPLPVQRELQRTMSESAGNSGLIVRLALNYGGRAEILDAMGRIAEEVRQGRLDPNKINEEVFRRYMYDPEMSDPDLIIRTGGEMRVSNFLLWHLSYAELWVTPVCWPDFRTAQLEQALDSYAQRQRRFGGAPGAAEGQAARSFSGQPLGADGRPHAHKKVPDRGVSP
jgi:undecaprenyl diphosphate synthase